MATQFENESTAVVSTLEKCREISGCPAGVDLQDHLRQLATENLTMLRLLTDISENHMEYFSEGEDGMFAGVPLDYVSEINMYVSRDVNAENPFPATDAYLAGIKADGVEEFLKGSQLPYQIATVLADYDNADDETLHHVIWSGQPPEPDGDVWHLEYVSRGNAIVREVLKQLREGAK